MTASGTVAYAYCNSSFATIGALAGRIGVERKTASAYVNGHIPMQARAYLRMMDALGLSVQDVLGGDGC